MHNIETMAYVGKTPWHSLGAQVAEGTSPEDFLIAAGLDWTVEREQLMMSDNFEEVDFYAIRRSTDKRIFGVGGRDWEPFQNAEVFGFFDEFCKINELSMETGGSLKDGEVVWALAKAGDQASFADGRDKMLRYYLLCNSHKPGVAFRYMETSVRVVCWNTLTLATSAGNVFKLAHRGSFDSHDETIAKNLKLKGSRWAQSMEQIERWRQTPLTADQQRGFANYVTGRIEEKRTAEDDASLLAEMLEREESRSILDELRVASRVEQSKTGKSILEAIIESPGSDIEGAKGTLWGAVNGVTYWADHGGSMPTSKRASSLIAGTRARYKDKAVVLADKVASAF